MAVGSSIATVAVLDTNADSIAVIRPKAITVRVVDLDTPFTASIRNANRRATPCWSMAWAMMNAPMKVNTVEEPNGASTVSASPTPSSTISAMPIRPPTGIGTASVIHRVTTPSRIAASVCWLGSRSIGSSRKIDDHRRRQEQAHGAPAALEALLLRAQLLLAEAPVGAGLGDQLFGIIGPARGGASSPPLPCGRGCPGQRAAETRSQLGHHVGRAGRAAQVRRARPVAGQRALHRGQHRVGRVLLAQVLEHLGARPDRPQRVGHPLARDVGRRAVHRLEHRRVLALGVQVGRRRDADRAGDRGGQVAEDVAEQVGGHDHVEAARVQHHHAPPARRSAPARSPAPGGAPARPRSARPSRASCG